jgi:hypothetical protein
LAVQPGLVLKAAFVESFIIEEMETEKMMLIRYVTQNVYTM